jgi:hypothetical protein
MSTPFDFGNKFNDEDNEDPQGIQEETAVSFLGFDVGELYEDFAITAPPPSSPSRDTSKPQAIRKRRRRKRARRSCTIQGCANRVVQGGVCITHGAKRKPCKFTGCDKSVKKAGYCSTHGPARKGCEIPGCSRVAVQGGVCIGHGAKKNQCEAEGCRRLASMAGLCKAHCDEVGQAAVAPATPASATSAQTAGSPHITEDDDSSMLDQCFEIPNLAVATAIAQAPVPSRAFQQTMYARGLSIFEEMGVASGRVVGNPLPPPPPLPQQQGPRHRSTLSKDLQSMFDEDLDLGKFEAI